MLKAPHQSGRAQQATSPKRAATSQPVRANAQNRHASCAATRRTKSGLSNGAPPDSEPQFLQAVNTQRARGKKMDDFDAEFNRLQIAKRPPHSRSVERSRRV